MAGPPNRSGKGPTNKLGGMDFESLAKRAQRSTVQSEQDLLRSGELINMIDETDALLEQGVPSTFINELQSKRTKANERLTALNSRSDIRQRAQIERVSDLTQSQLSTTYSSRSVNGQSMEISRSSTAQNASIGMMGTSWETLERRKGTAQNTIATLGARASALGENLYDSIGEQNPRKLAELQRLEAKRNAAVNVIGNTEAAMRSQRILGMDPQSRMSDLYKTAGQAQGMLNFNQMASDMRQGGVNISKGGQTMSIGAGDVNKALEDEARNLTETLRKLQQETDTTSKSFKKLKDEAEESAGNFEKLKEASSMGGGGASGSQKMAALSGGFNAAAGAAQEILVNQRFRQIANISGLANIENQKYDTYRTAAAGNIQSQLQLSQFGRAEGFGGSLAKGQLAALGLQAAGGVAQTGAGYAQMVEGGAQKNPLSWAVSGVMGNAGAATNEVIQGGLATAQGVATTATTGFDIGRGLSTTSARIQGVTSYMEATKALSYVGAEQLQGFRDYSVGASVAAQGMGRAGNGFLNRSISVNNISRMAQSRIGPEQFNQLAAQGVAGMGSTFNENQIFAARGLERSGMGTMQDNMQRMSQLATAGSNNPQTGLVNVLEAAVSKGMDSSKAINMLVDHSATMAASSVGRTMGLDVTGASATMLSSMVGGAPNKEAALARAASLQERIRDIGTNSDMSFSGMVATARISKSLGIGGVEAISAQGIDTETLKTMQGLTPAKRSAMFRERGINVSSEGSGKMVDTLLHDRAATLLEGKGIGFAIGNADDRERILNNIKGGKTLSKDDQLLLGKMASASGNFGTGTELASAVGAVFAGNEPNAKSRVANDIAGKGGGANMQTADDLRTQGFKQLSQAALEATKGFKTAADTLKALGVLAKSVENIGDTGGEGKFKGAAAASAESFGKATMQFDRSVDVFSKSISIFADKAGLRTEDAHDNRENNKTKQPTHKLSGGQRG